MPEVLTTSRRPSRRLVCPVPRGTDAQQVRAWRLAGSPALAFGAPGEDPVMTHIGLELEVGSMFRVITHGANVISRLWTEACRDGYSRDGHVDG